MTAVSTWTNRGKYELPLLGVSSPTFRLGLFGTEPANVATAQDYNTLSEVSAGELTNVSGTGYVRKTLSGVSVTEDDAGNLAVINFTSPLLYSLIDAGTVKGAWVWRRVGGSDSGTDPLWVWLNCTDLLTYGGDLNVAFNATTGLSTVS